MAENASGRGHSLYEGESESRKRYFPRGHWPGEEGARVGSEFFLVDIRLALKNPKFGTVLNLKRIRLTRKNGEAEHEVGSVFFLVGIRLTRTSAGVGSVFFLNGIRLTRKYARGRARHAFSHHWGRVPPPRGRRGEAERPRGREAERPETLPSTLAFA